MRITFRALTLALFTLATWLVVMPSYTPPPVVEFHTVAPDIDPMALAETYAAHHGLTCTTPAQANLDDTFLTLAVGPDMQPNTNRIVPVDLDTALDSAGKRLVLLACTQAGE